MAKYTYFFGDGRAEGNGEMKNLLGGKGADLAEMAGHPDLRLPVPPGFTITTKVCDYYYKNGKRYPPGLKEQVGNALKKVEAKTAKKFGDPDDPLLVSVRSGARRSMPGMMETVLNIGLTSKTIPGLIRRTQNERSVYDAFRRLIMMYADVVMEKAAGIEPKSEEAGIRQQLEKIMLEMKKEKGYKEDTDLTASDLKNLCDLFKAKVKRVLLKEFPDDPFEQLWGGIKAVIASWYGKRAVAYRRIENIPDDWGTAVTVQTMVFGNMGENSATGVAFTRNPGNGENEFYGEYLINAQGEDVVAGIRTPAPINEYSKSEQNKDLETLEEKIPDVYKQLCAYRQQLEKHYHDMLDIEFTVENGKLFMLQSRVGKRNGLAAVRMAMDMYNEGLIDKKTAVMRVTPHQLNELLLPIINPKAEMTQKPLAEGLAASPGGACGMIVLTADEAVKWTKVGKKKVILVREETSPEDVEGMRFAEAILTARGGLTSHAAIVARGWGKCCVVGCSALEIDLKRKQIRVNGKILKEGEWITLDGIKGYVFEGQLPMIEAGTGNKLLFSFLKLCHSFRKLGIRANADTPEDAKRAREFGAEGIGLFRTEHMFYGRGLEEPLFLLRKMIVAKNREERQAALEELFPYVKSNIKNTLEVMEGLPVTIRLLDPPLHEFVPTQEDQRDHLARSLNISRQELDKRAQVLHESNPMMGHRGVRLGITYPEITAMQVRTILEATAELIKQGKKVYPEIMVPVVCDVKELIEQKKIVEEIYPQVLAKYKLKNIPYSFGTMIEIPRASLLANELAEVAEFFSYGTNDLTQMGFGFSRDDIGSFVPFYLEKKILPIDPFQSIDKSIGELIKIGIKRGRKTRPNLKVGICGEHGGDPASIALCHRLKMNYVSCSPFRVPVAIVAAAQAAIKEND